MVLWCVVSLLCLQRFDGGAVYEEIWRLILAPALLPLLALALLPTLLPSLLPFFGMCAAR